MKKLSLLIALIMILMLSFAMTASAELVNLLAVDTETAYIDGGVSIAALAEDAGLRFGVYTTGGVDPISLDMVSFDSTVTKVSSRSLKLDTTVEGASPDATVCVYIPNLEQGKQYVLQCWVKTEKVKLKGDDGGVHLATYSYNSEHEFCESGIENSEVVNGTKDWKLMSVSFKIPKDQANTSAGFVLSQSTGTAWFDGMVVFEGKKADASIYGDIEVAEVVTDVVVDDVIVDDVVVIDDVLDDIIVDDIVADDVIEVATEVATEVVTEAVTEETAVVEDAVVGDAIVEETTGTDDSTDNGEVNIGIIIGIIALAVVLIGILAFVIIKKKK